MNKALKAKADANVLTDQDKNNIRQLVEFVLYCQHESPRSSDISCVVPTALVLKKRFSLKMNHYDREHPGEDT